MTIPRLVFPPASLTTNCASMYGNNQEVAMMNRGKRETSGSCPQDAPGDKLHRAGVLFTSLHLSLYQNIRTMQNWDKRQQPFFEKKKNK